MIPAAAIARLHTVFASSAFIAALLVGTSLHYHKIVKNSVAQYPDEWFPSVSATIGDWFPERNIFQILIALTSGPRFALVFLQYYLHHSSTSSLSTLVFIAGIVRTLSCGGWVYITSSDNHDIHDFMMILYMVCNIPWMLGGIATTPPALVSVRRKRILFCGAFFFTIVPLVYFFIQHKVHRVPGAYTRYAFFEWGLILFDVLYDSVAEKEFKESRLQISFLDINSKHEVAIERPMSPEYITSAVQMGKNENEVRHRNPRKPIDSSVDAVLSKKALADSIVKTSDGLLHDAPLENDAFSTTLRNGISFLSDVYLTYVFWSLFTALIPTLFYFSVWELGIAGHELALLSVLSPMLLALSSPHDYFFASPKTNTSSSPVLQFTRTRGGQAILHLLSLMGILAYLIPSPGGRLGLVALANIIAVMRQAVVWVGVAQGEGDVSYQAVVTGIAVLVSSLAKQANRANNPIWPFINHKAGGYNNLGLFLSLLAIYEYATRPDQTLSPPSFSTLRRKNSLLGALPLGSLLFCLHNLLSESSTLIAWSWTGYENRLPRGPLPHIHGSLTIVAMALGLSFAQLSRERQRFASMVSHPIWFLFGSASAYVLYSYRDWTGYFGGLCVSIFLTSVIPLVFNSVAKSAVGTNSNGDHEVAIAKTYTTALGVYCVLNLMSIFTVAYAFVPGGVYFRERTDAVTVLQMACLLPAFNWQWSSPAKTSAFRTASTNNKNLKKAYTFAILSFISICSLLITLYRLPSSPPRPFKSGTRIFNAGIWTVHFGIDNEGHDSQRGIMNLIRDMELDVVGLLETDLHRTAFGHRDLTRLIVEESNYYVDIGPGPNAHTWGAVLLSKFPIISTKHHLLPSPNGELAPAIEAVLDIYGTEVLILISHNGQEEDPLDRELQSTELAKIMAASTRPVIFLGYVVTKPWAPRPSPYGIMVLEGNVHDIDADDGDRWCEYIFYRGLYRTSYARISRGIITDTETQIGQFVLPRHGHNVTDDSLQVRYLRSRKEELPVEHWFPMEYYGNAESGGVNGHYYHVFNTPLYYKIPENAVL